MIIPGALLFVALRGFSTDSPRSHAVLRLSIAGNDFGTDAWLARVGAAGYIEVWAALADADDERTLVQIVGAPALTMVLASADLSRYITIYEQAHEDDLSSESRAIFFTPTISTTIIQIARDMCACGMVSAIELGMPYATSNVYPAWSPPKPPSNPTECILVERQIA